MSALQQKLSALGDEEQQADVDGEDAERLWEQAQTIHDMDGLDAAEPLLRRVIELKPRHSAANYLLGHSLLHERSQTEGVEYLKRILDDDDDHLVPFACQALADFYQSTGQAEELRLVHQRLSQFEAAREAGERECSVVTAADSFLPHELSETELAALVNLLEQHRDLASAHLVRKSLKHFPDRRLLRTVRPNKERDLRAFAGQPGLVAGEAAHPTRSAQRSSLDHRAARGFSRTCEEDRADTRCTYQVGELVRGSVQPASYLRPLLRPSGWRSASQRRAQHRHRSRHDFPPTILTSASAASRQTAGVVLTSKFRPLERVRRVAMGRIVPVFVALIITTPAAGDEPPDFNRDVLPLLTAKCFKCHGPDAENREAGLRLDREKEAKSKLPSDNIAIVPGDLEASALIERIVSKDPDTVMPPPESREQLTEDQIEILKNWISTGARYQRYWAYAPIRGEPRKPTPAWGRNAIDYFVFRRLQKEKLKPSPEAERSVLIRRLSFDITGLPPTPEEVRLFTEDKTPRSYEKLVDRLLASKHYGEQMAVYWLDLVRYADSVGYHGDQTISVSPFRDYVIDAFNGNMPFDRFTREQLAGDLLPNATVEQKVASGYNRLGMMSAEGGVQPKEYLAKYAAERVRNVSLVWMGSTMGCCECHDHKYDPFTMTDFYSMASFFADIQEKGIYAGAHASGKWGPSIEVADPRLPELLRPIDSQIAKLQGVLDTQTPELTAAQAEWEKKLAGTPQWRVLTIASATALHNTKLTVNRDQSVLASGPSPPQNSYTLRAATDMKAITGFRIEVMPDKSLPKGGPGRAGNGNFVISEFKVRRLTQDGQQESTVSLQNASATIEQKYAGEATPYGKWNAASAIDGDIKGSSWGWAILPDVNKTSYMVVETKDPLGDDAATELQFVIEQNHENAGHTLGKFRLWATTAPHPLRAARDSGLPPKVQELLAIPDQKRTDAQRRELAKYYRSVSPLLQKSRAKIAELKKRRDEVRKQHTRTSHITVAVKPREMRVLPRGNWMDNSGRVVEPAVPTSSGRSRSRAERRDATSPTGWWLRTTRLLHVSS